ncbi:Cell adhesion molecule 4 [Merluccius polli]|uniref:Cell adhesion molecule 4 n=1 Tax=Merluccius polli TaxID=89951 RepID=A0AA47PDD2_MERPO|nr:Cell adhesion molecule 4 [Merluccius polli]
MYGLFITIVIPIVILIIIPIISRVSAGDWSVNVPINPVCAVVGSTVVLPCSYDYPEDPSSQPSVSAEQDASMKEGQTRKVPSEMWCLGSSRCITQSYVFHSAGIFLDPAYNNRVKYLGLPGTKNCSLQISEVRMSDGGAYVFYVITSHPTQKMPPQTGVRLLVSDSPDAVTVSVSPRGVVTKGESVHLACCSPTAGPAGRYHWFMDHASNSTTNREYPGQVWTMNEAQANASGTYFCQVQTAEGSRHSTNITIDVQYPPYNTTVMILRPGLLTEGLVLTCSSDANPPVHTYTWHQGPGCLTTEGRTMETLDTPIGIHQTLHTNITTEESGPYCCVASNDLGSHNRTLMLSGGSIGGCMSSHHYRKVCQGQGEGLGPGWPHAPAKMSLATSSATPTKSDINESS